MLVLSHFYFLSVYITAAVGVDAVFVTSSE